MANNGYIVNRSNYTTKKKHKTLSDSTIMERDYMITTNLGGWGDNFIGYDGANNFKILQGSIVNNFRKHSYGKWLEPPTSCAVSYGDESFWGYCDAANAENTENTIVPKYDYNSLRNFAYFGSCYELVTTSLEDIINKFPGELYITAEHDYYQDKSDGSIKYLVGSSALAVSNPFEIDVFSTYIPREVPDSLKYRYFFSSNGSYTVYDNNSKPQNGSWVFTYNTKDCYSNGDTAATATFGELTLYKCYRDGEFVIMANGGHEGWHIRPSEEIVENFFNNLDDFEAFLLNRESNPLYTITIEAPYEDKSGNFRTPKKTFTWPVSHGWNLVLGGSSYSDYVNSLLDIASLYDEYFTDNLWKSMTHEAIKNMDDTITRENSDETVEDYRDGVGRMRGLFLAYGRFFDDIKRQADNIRFTTSVTYDENGNLPDYFLSDELGLSGWESYSIKDYIDKSNEFTGVTISGFTGISHAYTANDASSSLLKVLKINSENILSKKGTRRGIESVLGMFGLLSEGYINELDKVVTGCAWKPDYKIDEYTRILSGKDGTKQRVDTNDDDDATLTVETWNQFKTTMPDRHSVDDGEYNPIQGLPIAIIEGSMKHDKNELKYRYSRYYMVPWFSKSVEYDGNPWYQMKGGWCKLPEKEICEDITNATSLTDDKILYGETKKKMTLVKDFKELATYSSSNVKDKEVFYVYDIEDYENYFGKKKPGHVSHYFIANSGTDCNTNSGETGYYADTAEKSDVLHGWDYVETDKNGYIQPTTENGKRIIYMESLIDDSKENNPHTGYPNYDNGEEFWKYFTNLYKGAIDNDELTDYAYECSTGNLKPEIADEGFEVKTTNNIDNVKCWYFTDPDTEQIATTIVKNDKASRIEAAKGELDLSGFSTTAETDTYSLTGYNELYDFEKGEKGKKCNASEHTVGQSFGIMNTKVLTITFFNYETTEKNKNAYNHFLYNAVLPYLRQVIPSTSIWEVKILYKSPIEAFFLS